MTEEIIHLSSEGFQEWVEDLLKRRFEKQGFKNVGVGCPCPHGKGVYSNITDERLIATIVHSEGQFTRELMLKPWYEQYVMSVARSIK
jgi:disulfide oxidoreductase YuzD